MKRSYEILDIQFDDVLNYVQVLIGRDYGWPHINSVVEWRGGESLSSVSFVS